MSHETAPAADDHAHAGHEHDDHAHSGGHPHINYLAIFFALCICTALSVAFDFVPSKKIATVLVLAIATAKAQFVMRYFMHLKFEGLWKYVILLPTAILAVGLPLALAPDIAMHYYRPETETGFRAPSDAAAPTAPEADGHHDH